MSYQTITFVGLKTARGRKQRHALLQRWFTLSLSTVNPSAKPLWATWDDRAFTLDHHPNTNRVFALLALVRMLRHLSNFGLAEGEARHA